MKAYLFLLKDVVQKHKKSIATTFSMFALLFLICLRYTDPDIRVIPGRQLNSRLYKQITSIAKLDTGEVIYYFYSNAWFDITGGFSFLTNKKIVVYSTEYIQKPIYLPFDVIEDVDIDYSESFWKDSYITIATKDSGDVQFPVSSEMSGDRRFHNALNSFIERHKEQKKKHSENE